MTKTAPRPRPRLIRCIPIRRICSAEKPGGHDRNRGAVLPNEFFPPPGLILQLCLRSIVWTSFSLFEKPRLRRDVRRSRQVFGHSAHTAEVRSEDVSQAFRLGHPPAREGSAGFVNRTRRIPREIDRENRGPRRSKRNVAPGDSSSRPASYGIVSPPMRMLSPWLVESSS
jgi:hypothetical protein